MEKVVVAVLTLFVVLTVFDVAPMITAERPLVKPMIPIVPMKPIKGGEQTVSCPLDTTGAGCNDNQTCCLFLGGFGCCTAPFANCCSDYTHCCGSGYVCDEANNQCLKAGSLPEEDVLEKLPLKK